MMSQNMGNAQLGELNFVVLHVPSLTDVRTFYVETLGMTALAESPTFLTLGQPGAGAQLGIQQGDFTPGTASVELWWQVQDADALHQALAARGVRIVQPPKDEPFGRTVMFDDPVGNTLRAYQPPKR
jgi:predicted enzyme related to lactoylglutathione lyase